MGKPPFAGFLPLLWMLLFTVLFAFALAEELSPLPPPFSSVPGWVVAFQPACKVGSGPAPSFYKRFSENVLLIRRI